MKLVTLLNRYQVDAIRQDIADHLFTLPELENGLVFAIKRDILPLADLILLELRHHNVHWIAPPMGWDVLFIELIQQHRTNLVSWLLANFYPTLRPLSIHLREPIYRGYVDMLTLLWPYASDESIRNPIEEEKQLPFNSVINARFKPFLCTAVLKSWGTSHLAVIDFLLADPRVDPNADHYGNTAFSDAVTQHHVEVVERLVADPRVTIPATIVERIHRVETHVLFRKRDWKQVKTLVARGLFYRFITDIGTNMNIVAQIDVLLPLLTFLDCYQVTILVLFYMTVFRQLEAGTQKSRMAFRLRTVVDLVSIEQRNEVNDYWCHIVLGQAIPKLPMDILRSIALF